MDYLALNRRGVIPGPQEAEQAFRERALQCVSCENDVEVLRSLSHFYDIYPDWVRVIYDNKGLSPWEGAATFLEEGKPPVIQLRSVFKKRSRFLGLYEKKEVLMHEMVHAARCAFNEPRFEELLAYQTSAYKWRAVLGSLFQKISDAYIVLGTIILSVALTFFGVFEGIFLPYILAVFGAIRLFRLFKQWGCCQNALRKLLGDDFKVRAVMFRLSDNEIKELSKMQPEQILSYLKGDSYRLKIIYQEYFSKDQ